jgi:hypothetical protein
MAYVEKLRLQAQKMAVLANEKSPFSAIFPLCIQGAGQRGPWAGRAERKRTSTNWARRSLLYSRRRFPAKTGVCRTAMRNKFGMIALPGQAQLFTAPGLRCCPLPAAPTRYTAGRVSPSVRIPQCECGDSRVLTNAFSKKLENLEHAVSLHLFHYNFIRRHQTLRVTPAQAAGVTHHLRSIEELVELIDQYSQNSN